MTAQPDDAPLTADELGALSRIGLEYVRERQTPGGLTLVTMRDMHADDWPEAERTPGGWRMLLP